MSQTQRNVSAAVGDFVRLDATSSRSTQLALGSVKGQVLTATGTATASLTDAMTHINLPSSTSLLTINVPNPSAVETAGINKIFVMDAPGNVTILSNGGAQSVRLSQQGQSCMLTWTGAQWVIVSSSQVGSVQNQFDYQAVYGAIVNMTILPIAGPLAGLVLRASAFFISADGYVVTCAHCVLNDPTNPALGFARLHVQVADVNGTAQQQCIWISPSYDGSGGIVGIDGNADIAVFRVPGITNQTFLNWGNTRSKQFGETVYTVGFPRGSDLSSVSVGYVRDPKYWYGNQGAFTYNQDALLYSNATNANSGSAVLDGQMQVVGVYSFYTFIQPQPDYRRIPSAVLDYATTCALDSNYVNGPPGTLSANANNTPLVLDGYTFTVADVGVTTFLVKDGTFVASSPLDMRTNGSYVFTAVETAGTPWQAQRIPPFTQADVVSSGGFLYGEGPTVPSYLPTICVAITSGPANSNTVQSLINSVAQIDSPLQDNLIFQDASFMGIWAVYLTGTCFSGATSQHQAQPIVEAIISGSRTFPAPNPVLNSVGMYTQKGWLGCSFTSWTGYTIAAACVTWGLSSPPLPLQVFGAQIYAVEQGGINYPIGVPPLGGPAYSPIEVAFDTAFAVAPGTLRTIVNGTWLAPFPIPLVVPEINGQQIGSQDGPEEVPIAQVLYSLMPGDVVSVILVDPLGLLFGPPNTAIQLLVTMGTIPTYLDYPVSGNASMSSTTVVDEQLPKPFSDGVALAEAKNHLLSAISSGSVKLVSM
jgi:hypothetical protein